MGKSSIKSRFMVIISHTNPIIIMDKYKNYNMLEAILMPLIVIIAKIRIFFRCFDPPIRDEKR